MITNFKIFENENYSDLKFENYSNWIIYGSNQDCINILTKMKKDVNNNLKIRISNVIQSIEKNIQNKEYLDTIGTVISYYYGGYVENCYLSYWNFNGEIQKEYNLYKKGHDGFTLRGELKNINGKIVVDTFDSDIKKYNL